MSRRAICAVLVAALAGGCGVSANQAAGLPPASVARPKPASFPAWREEFRTIALRSGISAGVFEAAFQGVTANPEVARLDGAQAEFTKPIWVYLDGAASADRVAVGRTKRAELSQTLQAIESRFGVDGDVVLAIWGMESNYGRNRGSMSVVGSLATLGYEGRRRDFAEAQLLDALRILQSGAQSPSGLVGSWAGAMGHTQFMPSSYLAYGVDFTGDGRADIWGEDPRDALASTANYLARKGWVRGQPWGMEVRLPGGFNFGVADQSNRRPVADWRARGVTTMDGRPLPDYGAAAIITPGGMTGPAFAVFDNFFVIKTYNNATAYAMGVGHLGDRIGGGGPIQGAWPRHERELSRTEKMEMQRRLIAMGFDTGATDGVIGPNTIQAIRAYQQSRGLTPDGFATAALLADMR
jgi:membrane-bound lytic murein transglycosylase B